MTKEELGRRIVEASYVRGDFLLRSGQRSSEYFDKYQFESSPALLKEIARSLVPLVPKEAEVLAGLELGGVPIATAISLETELPTAFVRKARKDYGTRRVAEGTALKGKRVCIIEDVITTGGQVIASAKELVAEGAIIEAVLCVIWRGQGESLVDQAGYDMRALFKMSDLV